MGLGSWALSPHPHSQTWPQGETADTGQVCPIFRGTLFPDSLMSQVHLYAQVCLGISGGGSWGGGCRQGHGCLRQACPRAPNPQGSWGSSS